MAGSAKERIEQEAGLLAAEAADRLGLEVVEVTFRRQGKYTLLRVDVDRPGAPGVTLAECETMNRELSCVLDEADLIDGRYELQVSSPGLDRPIRTDDDIRRNTGRRIVVDTEQPVEGRHSLSGVLLGVRDDALVIRIDDEHEARIPRAGVIRARQEVGFAGKGGDSSSEMQRKRRGIV